MFADRRLLSFIWLWIVAVLVGVRAFSIEQRSFSVLKPSADHYVMAVGLSPESQFAFAQLEKAEGASPRGDVKVYNIGYTSECWINSSFDNNVSRVGLSSLKWLSDRKVLLTMYNTLENGDSKFQLIHFDLQDCKFTPIALPKEHFIITYPDSDKFDILVSDRHVCKGANGRCRISYDGLNSTVKPFEIDLDWNSLHVELTSSRDFLIRGLDSNGIYKYTLLDRSFGTRKDLLSIPNAKNMEFMSSEFSICWIEKPGEDKSVQCSQFNNDWELAFHQVVTYRVPVTLVSVQTLTSNKTLLLVGKAQCESDSDCWNLFVTQVQPTMKISASQETRRFPCSASKRRFVVFRVWQIYDAIDAEYVCDGETVIMYNHEVIGTPTDFDRKQRLY